MYRTGKFWPKGDVGNMARVGCQRTGQREETLLLENVSVALQWSSNSSQIVLEAGRYPFAGGP